MKLSEVKYKNLSPMMQQYADIKKNYQEEFLFYRVGDFYELFFEDAIKASRLLELTLTGKSGGLDEKIPMAGVPHHSVKSYIQTLIKDGYKVAICDQVEDPKEVKGMVRREVVEVISSGSIVDLELLDANDSNYIASLLDFHYTYLLTYADISTGDIYSEFISKENLLNRVINLNIKEVIVLNNFDLDLINTIKNKYKINLTIVDKFYEKEIKLVDNIEDYQVKQGAKHLLYYLIEIQLKEVDHFADLKINSNDNFVYMDNHTIKNLEIFETIRNKERKYSLIWLLDKCKTSMGSRTLKEFLLNPLKEESKINERLDLIEVLNNQFILRSELLEYLYEVYDLERLSAKVITGSLNARDVLQIKKTLKQLPHIKDILNKLEIGLNINPHNELYEFLEKSIYEEPPITLKEGYLIKKGYNEELDELKEIRANGKAYLSKLENQLKEETGINNLKLGYNKVFGYYIEISKGSVDKVKDNFGWERKQTLTTGERYITPQLKEKEALILNAEEKIINLEYNLFLEIKEILRKEIKSLKETAKNIGYLDAITSLSVISEEYKLIRPIFNNDEVLEIRNGFHPVVSLSSGKEYVKNDILMNRDINTLLITGPNMSGKSTYMRQLAITVIMAQIGSFVPADKAFMPIFDKIFTRIGASDDLTSGESTFMVEMLEARDAAVNATKNSLILFDELGRGTSTYDGMSIAEAILEYINTKIKCKTLFSTHYHELTSLDKKFKNIKNIHVSAEEENGRLVFLHKVKSGGTDKSYGIHVAALANMPDEIIKRASEILSEYENKPKKVPKEKQLTLDITQDDQLRDVLKDVEILKTTPIEALNILYKLKEIDKK